MGKDSRKKGCPNDACEKNKKKVKFAATEEDCPQCGTKLVFVCKKCFAEIEDIDPKHKICKLCEAKKDERNEKIKDTVIKAGGTVLTVAGGIAAEIGTKALKDGKQVVVKDGVKVVENVAKTVVKTVLKK